MTLQAPPRWRIIDAVFALISIGIVLSLEGPVEGPLEWLLEWKLTLFVTEGWIGVGDGGVGGRDDPECDRPGRPSGLRWAFVFTLATASAAKADTSALRDITWFAWRCDNVWRCGASGVSGNDII